MQAIRVGIIDDHAFFLSAFTQFLNSQTDIQMAFSSTNSLTAVEQVERFSPDLLLLDVSMSGKDGASVARDLHRSGSVVPILFLSISNDPKIVRSLSRLDNVSGYLLKHDDPGSILAAIRKAAQGERYLYSMEIVEGIVNIVEDEL